MSQRAVHTNRDDGLSSNSASRPRFLSCLFASLWPSKLLFSIPDTRNLSANMDYRKGPPIAAVKVEALVHLLFPSPKIFVQRKYALTRRRGFRWP